MTGGGEADAAAALVREGLALFDRGAYFEAHERIEDAWRLTDGPARPCYQALVQIAAACVHLDRGNPNGARKLLGKARRNLAAGSCPDWIDRRAVAAVLEALERAADAGGFTGEPIGPIGVPPDKK